MLVDVALPHKCYSIKPHVQLYSNIIMSLDRYDFRQNKVSPPRWNTYSPQIKCKKEIIKRSGIIFVSRQLDDLKFLVVKGVLSGIYSFPKGRQNDDENVELCASREVFEETGIEIDPSQLTSSNRIKLGKNTYFILEVNEDNYQAFNIQDREEICEVTWKSISELRRLHCNKDIRNLLQYPTKNYHYHRMIFN